MVDDIKFRVWNGMGMVYDVVVGRFGAFYVNPENNGLDPNDTASLTPLTTKYPNDIHVMRFTGMQDDFGKDIYEGDVVKVIIHDYDADTFQDYPSESEVKYSDGMFVIDHHLPLYVFCNSDDIECSIKVIGNKYNRFV